MALIPPFYLNTVVALGEQTSDSAIKYTATGFLYGHPAESADESGQDQYYLFLVTNRHVFQQASNRGGSLHVRFNKLNEAGTNTYSVRLEDASWTVHPNPKDDVAVLSINTNRIQEDGIEYSFFSSDRHALTLEQARADQISEGDGVFVLGFPLGEAGEERNYAIVRQGIVARVQQWLKADARTFLIDASIFPGNSGGPVLLKPEIASIKGTKANDRCSLIGMVSAYLPYQEVAVSQQTGRPRMIFEENSGLARVVPHDVIQEAVEIAVGKLQPNEQPASSPEPQSG